MLKSEPVQRIAARNPHLYQSDVENMVNAILGEITAALARSDRVEVRGFGVFSGPEIDGPHTTCCNRFVRWRQACIWDQIMDALAATHHTAVRMIDTSVVCDCSGKA